MRRFVECYVPVTRCNLKCHYCYVIRQKRRDSQDTTFAYPLEHMAKAFSPERWGGICLFSLTGAGETLIPHEAVDIAGMILRHGHYVNITTNGTLSQRFEEITSFPDALLKRIHFSFSMHYLELLRVSKLEAFFANIKRVRDAGSSILVQVNLVDEYIPHIQDISDLCVDRIGAPPQFAVTRVQRGRRILLDTNHSKAEYTKIGRSLHSPLFDFGMSNFLVKRKEFCYAGDWSFKLYLVHYQATFSGTAK